MLRVKVDIANPLAWGLADEVDVMFANSPTFRSGAGRAAGRTNASRGSRARRRCAAAGRSGRSTSTAASAVVDAKVGKGRLVLYGPQVLFRAQPHGTFKLVFNAIVRAGERP